MTPEDQAKLDRLNAATKALRESADDIALREDVKDAVKTGALLALKALTPVLAGLAGGPGGPAAAAVVSSVGGLFTQELQAGLARSKE